MASLDEQVARLEGWVKIELTQDGGCIWKRAPDIVLAGDPPYTTDPALWGALLEREKIELLLEMHEDGGCTWNACALRGALQESATPGEAVCRAYIASRGVEVEG